MQLEQQIDICNTQIADLQQKLLDADQGSRQTQGSVEKCQHNYCQFFFHYLNCSIHVPGAVTLGWSSK